MTALQETHRRGAGPLPSVDLVLASFGSGGAERVLLTLAIGLCDRGHAVRLLVLDTRGPLRDEVDARVQVVDIRRRRVRTAGPRLVRLLRAGTPSVIVASQTHVNVLVGLLRPLLPRKASVVFRQPLHAPDAGRRGPRAALVGLLLGRADLIVASSTPMRAALEHVLAATPRPAPPVLVLPNPVDVVRLRTDASTDAGPASDDVPAPADVDLVVVGRLIPQKGHADLLRALAALDGRSSHLTLVGDGPLRAALEAMVDDLGLSERTTFLGHLEDRVALATRVARADLLVQPAHYEGMPNTVLEALALGTPVLATSDLAVLADLAEELGPDALRLVPRDRLSDALSEVTVRPGPVPRPSLLPERFAVDAVVEALLAAIPEPERPLGA